MSLPIEKIFILNNVTIPIKSILNRDKNHYYCKIYLEKCLYQLAKNNQENFFYIILMAKFGETEK